MVVRGDKMRKCEKLLLQYCDAMLVLIPFSHCIRSLHFFAFFSFSHLFLHLLRILLALFTTFWCNIREISTKKVENVQKREKNAKSTMRMRNANAMRKNCDAMQ
jgi:hypothetical protein